MSGSGLAPGAIFAARYRIVRCLAQGGMGAVYEVLHLETERRRALKVMLPHVLGSPELRLRFQREARIAANVESDFIVDVFDAGYDEATQMPFLVMELLRGEEVSKRLKRLGRLPYGEVVAILHQTSLALDKTHKASIVHRDLKPENLFLTEREDGPPRIKVLDFGIAKVVAESATTSGLTQSMGTPLFMAPEQFNPRAVLTGAADLYALAMVAYKLLVGRAYWAEEAKGGNLFALAAVAIHGPKDPASQRAAEQGVALPAAVDGWFARATHVDPARRFATGAEMVAALAQALDVMSVSRAPLGSLAAAEGIHAAPYLAGFPTPAPSHGSVPRTPPASASLAASVPAQPETHTIDLPSLTCPAPDATTTAVPSMSSPSEAAEAPSVPSLPSMPSAPSMPSMPTGIAAPATAGTMPPPARRGPGRTAVVAVAASALGVLIVGAWMAVRGTGAPAASSDPPASAASAGDPPAPPVAAQPPLAVSSTSDVQIARAPAAAAAAAGTPPPTAPTPEPPIAAPASAPPPVSPPRQSAVAAARPPAPAPATSAVKKRKYTRE